jgi:hypothetical protein
MSFTMDGVQMHTSSYSRTDWTVENCVGVGNDCRCHIKLADSVTRDLALAFPNTEFHALLSAVR